MRCVARGANKNVQCMLSRGLYAIHISPHSRATAISTTSPASSCRSHAGREVAAVQPVGKTADYICRERCEKGCSTGRWLQVGRHRDRYRRTTWLLHADSFKKTGGSGQVLSAVHASPADKCAPSRGRGVRFKCGNVVCGMATKSRRPARNEVEGGSGQPRNEDGGAEGRSTSGGAAIAYTPKAHPRLDNLQK